MDSRRVPLAVWIAAVPLATANAALRYGGGDPADWNLSLLSLGLAIVIFSINASGARRSCVFERCALLMALFFPFYVALQLLPLPLELLRALSPARAEVTDALRAVMPASGFAPISIVPSRTWYHLSRIAGYALIFFLARESTVRCTRTPWVVALPLIVIGALETIWSFVQYQPGTQALSGAFLNKDQFAGLLEMVLPFALMYALTVFSDRREPDRFASWTVIKISASLCAAAGILAGITLSFSKMGFVSTLASLFVMSVFAFSTKLPVINRWFAVSGVGILLTLAFIFLPPNQLIEQFGSVAFDQTAEGRLPIAKDTLHLITAYPLVGTGLGTYFPALLRYQTFALDLTWVNAHNDYLQLLSELGILGFLMPAVLMIAVFVLAAGTAVSKAHHECRFLGLACAGGMTAILIHSFADFNLYVPANAMVLSWISGISAGLPSACRQEPPERSFSSGTSLRRFVLVLACLASVHAAAWLISLHFFKGDPQAESVFCRFGICDTSGALDATMRMHRVTTVAALPKSALLKFLERDPVGPYNWADLAESRQTAGQMVEARYCFSRALDLGPHIPSILFRAAQFRFGLREDRAAVELIAHAVAGDPKYEQQSFITYEDRRIPLDEILAHGLPNRSAFQDYLRFLIAGKKNADADLAWDAIISRGYADDKLANEYVEFLFQNGKPEAAAQAWAQYAGTRDPGYPQSNRIFNGGFESDPTGSRFDWTIAQTPGATVAFDRQAPHSGTRALRIQLDGTLNLSSIGVRQTVFLPPGHYQFQAYVRTKDVTTDEGLRFQVASEQAPTRLSFTTEPMLGSSDWKFVQHAFTTPPGGGMVEVRLVRTPSLRFDSLIRGTILIDQVSITPENRIVPARR